MSEFYYTLNSDGSRDIHPENHGGDFTIELYQELYFPDLWEVALVEMSYFGQYFPNIMYDDSYISIESSLKYEHKDQWVLPYSDADKVYIDYFYNNLDGNFQTSVRKTIPSRNYSLKALSEIIASELSYSVNDNFHVYIWIKTDEYQLRFEPQNKCAVSLVLSDGLVNLLAITDKYRKIEFRSHDKQIKMVPIKIPQVIDKSFPVFTPTITKPLWIQIDTVHKITIPNLYWTVDTINLFLASEIKRMFSRKDEFKLRYMPFTSIIFNYDANKTESPLTVEIETTATYMFVQFSPFLEKMFNQWGAVHIVHRTFQVNYHLVQDLENDYFVDRFHLPQNYFTKPSDLIESMNTKCLESINNIIKKQPALTKPDVVFSIDSANNICSFKAVNNFKITLTPFLQDLLNLDKTDKSSTGNSATVLPDAVRPYLYVESNLVEPHFINQDEHPLLRVINNTAKENERALISFNHLQYQKVSRSYFTSIHISIRDYYLGILNFSKPVSLLLHFRPCHSS